MRLVAELAVGVAACGIAYYLARPGSGAKEPEAPAVQRTSDRRDARPRPRPELADRVVQPPVTAAARSERSEGVRSPEQESAMTMLRNAAIVESARDMRRRGQDIEGCFEGARPVGVERLRFAVEVESTPAGATLGRWRFVEVADGEPVPPSFATCAARALGGGQRLVPPEGFRFLDYYGELSMIFTVPAPVDE